MIPVLYSQSESDYGHNGIGILSDVMYYTVTEEANGEFELYLEYPVNGRLFKELKYQRLIKAKPNDVDEDHVFRIYEIVKDLESHMVYIYATSKTNDLGTNLVKTLDINKKTAQEALNLLKTSLVEPTEFNFVSDITTRSSTYWEFRNPLSCIVGEDNSLVKYWGGEVKRTNDTVYLYARRGRDNVTVLREGKNIKGLEFTVSTKGLVTKIVPYFIRYDENTGEEIVTIGNTVSSPLVNNYPIVNIMPVDYTLWDELETAADLNAAASGYFTYQNPGVDKPKVSLDIDIMQLSESSQYKQYSNLESLIVFDSVTVYLPKFDVNVEVPVNKTVYNGLLERADNIYCGDPISSLFEDVRRDYTELIGSTESKLINIVQKAGEGSSTIFRGPDEPVKGMKPGDLWYKPIGGSDKEMYQWTGAYWELILSTKDINANKELVDAAVAMAEQAKQAAEQSYLDSVAETERLVTAQTEAFDAEMNIRKGEILEAKEQADLAVGKANANAEAIFGKLDLATYEANKTAVETELGKKLATATYTAQKQTQDALIAGKVALTTYNAKVSELNTAINGTSLRVDELEDGFALTATKTEVDSLKTRMNTAELSITATSNQVALKASQTDLNAATGRLKTAEGRITANTTAIELRATKTDVNSLTGRVTTAEGSITTQAGQIALRATTATVNALTGRVSTAEASIVAQAGRIDLAATKTEAQDYAILATKNSGRWTRSYRVNTATPMDLLEADGTLLSDEYSYMVSGVITGTGTITGAVVLFVTNRVGSNGSGWTMHVLSEKAAKNSNQIEFFIASNGRPSVRLYGHTTFYVVNVTHTKTYGNIDVAKLLEDSISTVQSNLTVEAGKITALTTRVGTTESNITSVTQTVSGINTTISTLRTDVNGKATIVSLNAVKSTADGNKTTISNHAGRLTTVETNVNGLQTTVASKASQTQVTQLDTGLTSVVTELNNLEVGGRNLIVSKDIVPGEYLLNGSGTVAAASTHARTGFIEAKPLTDYILSGDKGVVQIRFVSYNASKVYISGELYSGDRGASQIYKTPANTAYIRISADYTTKTHYNRWMLEKGNRATDWTPAPEDMATQSQITQLSGSINLRVTAGDVTAAILADKRIKDTRTTNELPSWYWTNYKSQRIEEFKTRTVLGVPGSATYVKLVTDVPWSDASGGVIVQTAYSSDGVYNRLSNPAGTAWTAWVKQTDSANVLAQVNLSTEGVLIQGKRIQLDGDVTMTAAYVTKLNTQTLSAITANITSIRSQVLVTDSVTSTHIKAENALVDTIFGTTALITRLTSKTAFISNIQAINISADKITTGTLNATNVNIINLNVSKLVGDTANFVKSAWNGLNSSLSIDSTGLKSYTSNLEIRLTAGYTRYYISNTEVGYMAPLVSTSDTTIKAMGIVAPSGGQIVLGRQVANGVHESLSINGDNGAIGIKRSLEFSLGGKDIGKIYGNSNGLIMNSPSAELQFWQGGTSVMYAVTGGLRMYRQINMNQNPIDNVTSLFAAEVATPILRKVTTLATDNVLNFTRAGVVYTSMISGGFRMQIQINMNTFDLTNVGKITYASDARYKSSIVTRDVSDLDIIRNIRYVDYTFNRDGSRQRGLIAQELMNADSKLVTTAENGYLSYDAQQYTHAIGHGLQELDGNVRDLRDGVLRTNADFLSKIEELENKIQQLEEKLA